MEEKRLSVVYNKKTTTEQPEPRGRPKSAGNDAKKKKKANTDYSWKKKKKTSEHSHIEVYHFLDPQKGRTTSASEVIQSVKWFSPKARNFPAMTVYIYLSYFNSNTIIEMARLSDVSRQQFPFCCIFFSGQVRKYQFKLF